MPARPRGRKKAFLVPAPPGWTPAAGERVYLPRADLGTRVAVGLVLVCWPPWARVRIPFGLRPKRSFVRVYRVRDLRPLPGPTEQAPAPEGSG